MKKNVFCIALVLSLFSHGLVFAFDFGLTLSNYSTLLGGSSIGLEQSNRLLAWVTQSFGSNIDLYASGYYQFQAELSEDSTVIVPYVFNVGRFELSGTVDKVFGENTSLSYNFGRISLVDFSNRVINGLNDGALASLGIGNNTISVFGAYRGLLLADEAQSPLPTSGGGLEESFGVAFAPASVVAGAAVQAAELLPSHDIGLEFWAMFDLDEAGGKTNYQYLEQYVDGRINAQFRWKLWNVLGFSNASSDYFAMASGGQIRYANPRLKNLRLTQSILWASGTGDNLSSYLPIQLGEISGSSYFAFQNVLAPVTELSFYPLPALALQTGARILFKSGIEGPSIPGATMRDNATGSYLGFEPYVGINYAPFSDLNLSLVLNLFVPETSAAFQADTGILFKANLAFTLLL